MPVGPGAGQVAVFDPKHLPTVTSQHWTPPGRAGQAFAHSASVVHDDGHFFSGGAGVVAAGGTVVAGAASGVATASAGDSSLPAQAGAPTTRRPTRIAVTANADFDKVACFTALTLLQTSRI
ncbi:MAG: hypothetical protein JWP97_5168 [Labilithrix sp.]|nr:hypothetical protein [Labilithrix sp.]